MSLTKEPTVRPLWYLASPYSKYPGGRDEAFRLACKKAGEMMMKGYAIFCPIAHSHPIEQYGETDKTHDFWLDQDIALLDRCAGMFVYDMPGWRESFGVNWEIDYMQAKMKPVVHLPFEETK